MIRSDSQPETLLAWMDCLADPARLRLLRLLERQELGVAELCDIVQMAQSTVSRHLKVLLEQGWLHSRRQGTNHFYEMILDELSPVARKLWLLAREQTQEWATASQDELRLERILAQRATDSQTFFAGAAGQWDQIRNELYGHRFDLHALLPLLPSHYVVADLGCGTAPLTVELARYVRSVIGVDGSSEMLKAARKRTGGQHNVDLRRGDLSTLPIRDGEVDAALMILALTYVDDPAAAIAEMARILKPGGRAVIVDLLKHDRDDLRRQLNQKHAGFSTAELNDLLTGAAMEHPSVRPLAPEEGAKAPALFVASAVRGGGIPGHSS